MKVNMNKIKLKFMGKCHLQMDLWKIDSEELMGPCDRISDFIRNRN